MITTALTSASIEAAWIVAATTTSLWRTTSCYIRRRKDWFRNNKVVMLQMLLMNVQMRIQIFNGHGFRLCRKRSNNGVESGAKTSQEKGMLLKVIQGLSSSSKIIGKRFKLLKIISNGWTSLFEGGQLKMKLHNMGTGMRCKETFKTQPHVTRGWVTNHLSN